MGDFRRIRSWRGYWCAHQAHRIGKILHDLYAMDFNNASTVEATSTSCQGSVNSRLSDEEMISLIQGFPRTRYYGSKRRLLGWIHQELKDIPFHTVLDGFGGTASVSLLFKAMGKEVTFHDGLLCNTIAAHALLADSLPFSDIREAHRFIEIIKPYNGFISKSFAGMYYTGEENRWLDGAAKAIHKVTNPLQRSIYLYSLFQACLKKRPFNLFHRANLNLRTNQDVPRSFGNHITWETPFREAMKSSLEEVRTAIRPTGQYMHILPPGDISDLEAGYDLVYLDPPYVSGSTANENYLKRYHFLEGLSNYADWRKEIDDTSSIKSLKTRAHISEWQSKAVFRERLFDLIKKHKKSTVVLSYVAGAYPTEEEISDHFKKNFRHVKVARKDFNHALAKEKKIELLFIGSNA